MTQHLETTTAPRRIQLAVIGGGPAGLRAAEVAASLGASVTLFDAKPSVGRKFLVAGKGGLNLTHGEAQEAFARRYSGPGHPPGIWQELLAEFSPADARSWAASLGVETFMARTGRVYPTAMKAAPLLRRWITRLRLLGVQFEMNHRWTGLHPGNPCKLTFAHGSEVLADAVIFALGGGSWPQTGSDGAWLPQFEQLGIPCQPLAPANCGWECDWPPAIPAQAAGLPLKNIEASADGHRVTGELLITRYGLEGGAIYQLGPALRAMPNPAITIDLKPTFSTAQLTARMESARHHVLAEAQRRWKLSPAATAILGALGDWTDAASLAHATKHCVIPLLRPRPIAEAISSAGGVCWQALDSSLMLRDLPGCFVAGEMIGWEAPTGGYLMQGCLATGTRAGRQAASFLRQS